MGKWTARASGDTIVFPVPHAYPLMLDVSDRLAVIIGGGAVGVRKANGLRVAGGRRIRVVSTTFKPGLQDGIERIHEPYEKRHLEGAALVFAATDDPAVNTAVVRDAKAMGILVNRADTDDDSDFTTPAVLHEGPLTICVSAGGSPALAAAVRDDLGRQLDRRWVALAAVTHELRPAIRAAAGLDPAARRRIFTALASSEALDHVDDVRRWLKQKFPELTL